MSTEAPIQTQGRSSAITGAGHSYSVDPVNYTATDLRFVPKPPLANSDDLERVLFEADRYGECVINAIIYLLQLCDATTASNKPGMSAGDVARYVLGEVLRWSLSPKLVVKLARSVLYTSNQLIPNKLKCNLLQALASTLPPAPNRADPSNFFLLTGQNDTYIRMSPVSQWPHHTGWTFHCWLYRQLPCKPESERVARYLYSFESDNEFGYYAHFNSHSNLVITSIGRSGKGYQHVVDLCLNYRQWYMITVVHSFNRWGGSGQLTAYIDGKEVSTTDLVWQSFSNLIFNHCYIGGTHDSTKGGNFCGRLSSVYLFSEPLTSTQVSALVALGSDYQGQFRFPTQSCNKSLLNSGQLKALFGDSRLYQCLLFAYSPSACDSLLCLNLAAASSTTSTGPRSTSVGTSSAGPAFLTGQASVVQTHSLESALQGIGGVELFYPLLDCRLDDQHQRQIVRSVSGQLSQQSSSNDDLVLVPSPPPPDHNSSPSEQVDAHNKSLSTNITTHNGLDHKLNSANVTQKLQSSNQQSLSFANCDTTGESVNVAQSDRKFEGDNDLNSVSIAPYLLSLLIKLALSSNRLARQLSRSQGILQLAHRLELRGQHHLLGPSLDLIGELIVGSRALLHRAKLEKPSMVVGNRPLHQSVRSAVTTTTLSLLSDLYHHLVCNPALWSRASVEAQDQLYKYLSVEFFAEALRWNIVTRVSTVLQAIAIIRDYFPVKRRDSSPALAQSPAECVLTESYPVMLSSSSTTTPAISSVLNIRANLLYYIRSQLLRAPASQSLQVELQSLMTYLCTVSEPENLHDVLHWFVNLFLTTNPPSPIIGVFVESDNGALVCIFKLLEIDDEYCRIYAVKLLAVYLSRHTTESSSRQAKSKLVEQYQLFDLLIERLSTNTSHLSMLVYNVLFETLLGLISSKPRTEPLETLNIEIKHPELIKVIACLINRSTNQTAVRPVKHLFLQQLLVLCQKSAVNRRHILHQSLWQNWLLALIQLAPSDQGQALLTITLLTIFRLLLYHAVRHEQGGWEVWNDTLGLVRLRHLEGDAPNSSPSRLSVRSSDSLLQDRRTSEDAKEATACADNERSEASSELDLFDSAEPVNSTTKNGSSPKFAPSTPVVHSDTESTNRSPPGTPDSSTPSTSEKVAAKNSSSPIDQSSSSSEFVWLPFHQLMLDDLLSLMERDFCLKSSPSSPVTSFDTLSTAVAASLTTINPDEASAEEGLGEDVHPSPIYALNMAHLIVDTSDTLVVAAGGLLPLLAAATSNKGDIGAYESIPHLSASDAICFALRLAHLADVCCLDFDRNSSTSSPLVWSGVEREKRLDAGHLSRQLLRLYMLAASRNALASRFHAYLPSAELCKGLKVFSNLDSGIRYVDLDQGHQSRSSSGKLGVATLNHQYNQMPRASEDLSDSDDIINTGRRASFPCQPTMFSVARRLLGDGQLTSLLDRAAYLTCLTRLSGEQSRRRLGLANWPWRLDEVVEPDRITRHLAVKRAHDSGLDLLTRELHHLVYTLQPTVKYSKGQSRPIFYETVIEPIANISTILQQHDLIRFQLLLLKSQENYKVAEASASALAYFLSVLMVSKYRDLLESMSTTSPFVEPSPPPPSPVSGVTAADNVPDDESCSDESVVVACSKSTSSQLTDDLNACLHSTSTLLRSLFDAFPTHFAKLLVGSHHGQSLMTPSTLATIHDNHSSVVELVMLLCSQEWQTSLQKHAGLAFMHLVNEGQEQDRAARLNLVNVCREAQSLVRCMSDMAKQAVGDFKASIQSPLLAGWKRDADLSGSLLLDPSMSSVAQRLRISGISLVQNLVESWLDNDDDDGYEPTFHLTDLSAVDSRDLVHLLVLDSWEDNSRRHRRLSPIAIPASSLPWYSSNKAENAFSPRQQVEVVSSRRASRSSRHHQLMMMLGSSSPRSTLHRSLLSPLSTMISTTSITSVEAADIQLSLACVFIRLGVPIYGLVALSKSRLYFERDAEHPENESLDHKTFLHIENSPPSTSWSFSEIRAIFTRRYLHQTVALELFVASRGSILFAFNTPSAMQRVLDCLPPVGIGSSYGLPASRQTSLMTPQQLFDASSEFVTRRWCQRQLSNFDYLIYLNTLAGRTYNDLNQYPIFPWILTNYSSDKLDLNDPSNYRDLSLPVGALNPQRRTQFDDRYAQLEEAYKEAMAEEADSGDLQTSNDTNRRTALPVMPPFHYGTHYSTSAFVLNYLIRLEPFTSLFFNLQGGSFDVPDRLFFSVGQTWANCQLNSSDVKELIPEFFYLPEMFSNPNKLPLGRNEQGRDVGLVELPEWADSSEHFVHLHAKALESDIVSSQLHNWIDLVFGYKQRGVEAVRATNVFHHLTYDGTLDWSQLHDPLIRKAVADQIRSFGQAPAQLLTTRPHPRRNLSTSTTTVEHTTTIPSTTLNSDFNSHHRSELCGQFKCPTQASIIFMACSPAVDSTVASDASSNSSLLAVSASRALFQLKWNKAIAARRTRRKSDTAPVDDASDDKGDVNREGDDGNGVEKVVSQSNIGNAQPRSDNEQQSRRKSIPSSESNKPPVYIDSDLDCSIKSLNSNLLETSADLKALLVGGFFDLSFRVYSLESHELIQCVFGGHTDVVTCLARSESNRAGQGGGGGCCYVATGSRDCTIQLWLFNTDLAQIVSGDESLSVATGSPSPVVSIVGHCSEIVTLAISSELGLVVSVSKAGTCLLHSTRGLLLRQLIKFVFDDDQSSLPWVGIHREGILTFLTDNQSQQFRSYTVSGEMIVSNFSGFDDSANKTSDNITVATLSSCGRFVLLADRDNVVRILNSRTLDIVHALPPCESPVRSLRLTPDQRFLLVGLTSGNLDVYAVNFGQR